MLYLLDIEMAACRLDGGRGYYGEINLQSGIGSGNPKSVLDSTRIMLWPHTVTVSWDYLVVWALE